MKKDHTEFVKKINRTGGGPPPTPPKLDDLQKIVQDIIPDLMLLPDQIFESSHVSQFLENDEDDPLYRLVKTVVSIQMLIVIFH